MPQNPDQSVLVYFIAMPDPIGIPKNVAMHFVYDERRTPYLVTPTIDENVADLLLRVGDHEDVALSFKHVPAAPADHQIRPAAALAALEHFKGDSEELQSVRPDSFNGPDGRFRAAKIVTVAEVAVFDDRPADAQPEDIDLEDLSDPTLRALHCVEHFVRSYNLAARAPARLPTYARVGPRIPLLHRSAAASRETEWQLAVQPLNHENIGDRPAQLAEIDMLTQIMKNVQLLSAADVRSVFQSEIIEAERLYVAEGDYASSIVKSAQACEILLEGLLGLLLWEEGGDAPSAEGPIEAAVDALSKALLTRVRSEFHVRLGGRWDPTSDGPVGNWSRLIAGPRNRIVHRGYRPRAAEAGDALEAVNKLDSYVSDLIAAHAKQFPRTALMWVTESGLKERKRWHLVRAFARHRPQIEPPWRDNYSAWRERVDSAISTNHYKR